MRFFNVLVIYPLLLNYYDIEDLKNSYIYNNDVLFYIKNIKKQRNITLNYKKGITMHFIIENMYYEGGYSTDKNDPGNYYNNTFFGTKYGLSATFLVPYKNLNADSIKNMTKKDAINILLEYIFRDYFVNFSDMFIFYYVLFTFYYSKELADYYICLKYNLNPTLHNAEYIYRNIPMTNEDALYLKKCFEYKLQKSKEARPDYAKSWDRKYKGLLERNSHLF